MPALGGSLQVRGLCRTVAVGGCLVAQGFSYSCGADVGAVSWGEQSKQAPSG